MNFQADETFILEKLDGEKSLGVFTSFDPGLRSFDTVHDTIAHQVNESAPEFCQIVPQDLIGGCSTVETHLLRVRRAHTLNDRVEPQKELVNWSEDGLKSEFSEPSNLRLNNRLFLLFGCRFDQSLKLCYRAQESLQNRDGAGALHSRHRSGRRLRRSSNRFPDQFLKFSQESLQPSKLRGVGSERRAQYLLSLVSLSSRLLQTHHVGRTLEGMESRLHRS